MILVYTIVPALVVALSLGIGFYLYKARQVTAKGINSIDPTHASGSSPSSETLTNRHYKRHSVLDDGMHTNKKRLQSDFKLEEDEESKDDFYREMQSQVT